MSDSSTTKLNHESHLLLDQTLLRLPYELSRNNFRTAHRHIEQTSKQVNDMVQSAFKKSSGQNYEQDSKAALASIEQAITRLQNLTRKLSGLSKAQGGWSKQSEARIQHLQELQDIPSLGDVKYEEWSHVRLDRVLVDYMLRRGYLTSAKALAAKKGIVDLTDLDEFEFVARVDRSLRREHRVELALAWCGENKTNLKKVDIKGNLEYELRLQQYIELRRTGEPAKVLEATMHARKFLSMNEEGIRAAGLLAFGTNAGKMPYGELYSAKRWHFLANLFLETHHTLFSLPQTPLLHIALSGGLSALKTPACHSKFVSPSSGLNASKSPPPPTHHTLQFNGIHHATLDEMDQNGSATEAASSITHPGIMADISHSVCPICSTELNELAKNVPYAQHSKSHVESDPVVLPNGRIYGRERLVRANEKLGTPEGKVTDPVEAGVVYDWREVHKVFIM